MDTRLWIFPLVPALLVRLRFHVYELIAGSRIQTRTAVVELTRAQKRVRSITGCARALGLIRSTDMGVDLTLERTTPYGRRTYFLSRPTQEAGVQTPFSAQCMGMISWVPRSPA